jgi:mevalonate kinase
MLSGEYTILSPGGSCLAYAVDKYLGVTIEAIAHGIEILSDMWPMPLKASSIVDLNDNEDIYVASVRAAAAAFHLENFRISVESELGECGLGSSSALRLGVTCAAELYARQIDNLEDDTIWRAARHAWLSQQRYQKFASGYDVITQALGGLLKITATPDTWPGKVENIEHDAAEFSSRVHVFIGKSFARTKDMVAPTLEWLNSAGRSAELNRLNDALQAAIVNYFSTPETFLWQALLAACREQRHFMKQSQFYPHSIDAQFHDDSTFDNEWTFKLTGAGGDDAIIVFATPEQLPNIEARLSRVQRQRAHHQISEQGIQAPTDTRLSPFSTDTRLSPLLSDTRLSPLL